MQDATALVGAEARNNIAVDGGALQRSEWDGVTNISPAASMVQGKVTMQAPGGTQLPYAWMEEEGGEIVPRPENVRGLLAWQDRGTGQWIFARRVYHKGKHYMANALQSTGSRAAGILRAAMTGIFDKVGR